MDKWDKLAQNLISADSKNTEAVAAAAMQIVAEFGRTLDRIAAAFEAPEE